MTLEQLIYFCEVYQLKSINAASIPLNISQQRLSTSIKQLEREFSTVFFLRNHKGVSVTKAGERFYESAQKIIAEYNILKRDLTFVQENISNALSYCKIDLMGVLTSTIASPLYQHLNSLFDNTFFDIGSFAHNNLFDHTLKTWSDIIFTTLPENSEDELRKFLPQQYALKHLSKISYNYYIWCANSHPLTQIENITPNILSTASYILPKFGTINLETIRRMFEPMNISFHDYYLAETHEIFIDMLKRGLFVTCDACANDLQPLIYPFLMDENDLLLKAVSKQFPQFYYIILYKKTHEQFAYAVADFLVDNFNF